MEFYQTKKAIYQEVKKLLEKITEEPEMNNKEVIEKFIFKIQIEHGHGITSINNVFNQFGMRYSQTEGTLVKK